MPLNPNTHLQGKDFDQYGEMTMFGAAPPNYRLLQARLAADDDPDSWVIMPLVPYDYRESARNFLEQRIKKKYAKGDFSYDKGVPLDSGSDEGGYKGDEDEGYAGDDEGYAGDEDEGYAGDDEEDAMAKADAGENIDELVERNPPHAPSLEFQHYLGTDNRGRDMLARLAYGFKISMSFALFLLVVSYTVGITVGAILGYYGGLVDLLGQRVIEVWQTVPFLYTVMILGAALNDLDVLGERQGLPDILQPSFVMLVLVLAVFSWMGISYYIRGEFLREKARDYVSAAISIGVSNPTIIVKHILPNTLTPVVTFAPFAVVSYISSLVALDYLGFGLPAPTPSWGELMNQALPEFMSKWWMVASPISALFLTLLLVVFIGEAVREAFDPKVFSRLR